MKGNTNQRQLFWRKLIELEISRFSDYKLEESLLRCRQSLKVLVNTLQQIKQNSLELYF